MKKGMLAPILIAVIVSLFSGWIFFMMLGAIIAEHSFAKLWPIALLTAAVPIMVIVIAVIRIKEIKKGEEDDLSKY